MFVAWFGPLGAPPAKKWCISRLCLCLFFRSGIRTSHLPHQNAQQPFEINSQCQAPVCFPEKRVPKLLLFSFLEMREVLPNTSALTGFYGSKNYAQTRVGSMWGGADVERVPGLPNMTLPLTRSPTPWTVLHRTRAALAGAWLPFRNRGTGP